MAEEEEKPKPKSKKIFINHIDTFHSYNIGKFLSKCVSGATLEEEEEEEEPEDVKDGIKEGQFEIYGTLLKEDEDYEKYSFSKIIKFDKREEIFKALSEIDVIIYNTLDDDMQLDECEWLSKALFDEAEKVAVQKQFILLSSVMTWAKTKKLEPEEDVELPFTEEDYRRRRPHNNYKNLLELEKNVTKRGNTKKEKLITYVVASGITYGAGENVFHYFFKNAWENAPQLEVFGDGQNVLPTIHVNDLAGVIHNLIDKRPTTRYILATNDAKNTLEEIVKAISKNLSTGSIIKERNMKKDDSNPISKNPTTESITKEEVLTNEDINQKDYDQLLLNLQIDSNFVKENMNIKWVSETGIVEGINKVVKEFKQYRNLIPFRVCILGPPAIGKTTIATEIAAEYKIHWVNLKELIEEMMNKLEKSAARINDDIGGVGGGGEDAEEEEDLANKASEDAELLEAIKESKEENDGRISTEFITKFLKMKLLSKPCRNQGFVLDNYPKTKEDAANLFNIGEDDEEEEEEEESEEDKPEYNKNLLPTHVFVLEADNEFLKKRVMEMPEEFVTGTHNTEEGFLRRLDEYRRNENVEDTVLNYFEDNHVIIKHIDTRKDEFKNIPRIVNEIKVTLGKPRNYYPTKAQLAAERREKEKSEEETQSQMSEVKKVRKQEEERKRAERKEEWTSKLEALQQAETAYLNEQSLPLSKYLLRHVMPVLTEGLIDCVKHRPDNAVDHLAEYLFRHNTTYD